MPSEDAKETVISSDRVTELNRISSFLTNKVPSVGRRLFLKTILLGGGAIMADQVFLGGTIREVFIKSILNPEYRQKVLDKIKRGEAINEFLQQVGDRTNVAEPVVLGEPIQWREDWMERFPALSVLRLRNEQHRDKTIFLAELPKVSIQVTPSERRGGITFYSEPTFLPSGSIILPGIQITAEGSSNAYIPATFTEIATSERIVTFIDSRTGERTLRDGAIVLSSKGRLGIVPAGQEDSYQVDRDRAVLRSAIPFSIDLDLEQSNEEVASSITRQYQQINNNPSVLGSDKITESQRYETFYLQMDETLHLLGIFKTDQSPDWETGKRLSISQAVDLALQLAKQKGSRKLIVVPTDPDFNDGIYRVEGDNWQARSITHKGEENLLQQPFYLTI